LKFGENLVIKKLLAMLSCLLMMLEQNSSMDATGLQLLQFLLACLLAESIEEVAFFLT
jgi:hypothetical protein